MGLQLVQDNATSFGHTLDHIKHASMELLDKYFYVQGGSLAKRRKKEKREEIAKDYDDSRTIAKGIEDGNLGLEVSSESSSGDVKKEAPAFDGALCIGLALGLGHCYLATFPGTLDAQRGRPGKRG